MHPGDDDPDDLVVDYRRGMYAVEQYLFARSYMYAQVYHHKTVRAAEWMFIKMLERFARAGAPTGCEPPGLEPVARMARGADAGRRRVPAAPRRVGDHGDRQLGRARSGLATPAARDEVLRDLSQRLVSRRLFKTIDLGDDASVIDRLREPVEQAAQARFGAAAHHYVQIDNAEQIGYRSAADQELYVIGHPVHGTVTLGKLLDDIALGRPMSTVRLLCAPELVDALEPIAERALRSGTTSR